MTVKETKTRIRALGLMAHHRHGEWKIYPVGHPELSYYTDDEADALGTAEAMSKDIPPNEMAIVPKEG